MLKIDVREQALIEKCRSLISSNISFKDLTISTESLPIGDIIIMNEKIEQVIIERKSVTDLMASIKDGRYEEQSFRLNGSECPNHNIIYLIEGNPQYSCRGATEKATFFSSIFSINHYKGFSTMRTSTMDETAFVLCNMLNKVIKSKKDGRIPYSLKNSNNNNIGDVSGGSTNVSSSYSSVVKKVKKDNITSENIGEIMLAQIPGVSSVSARSIFEEFKTMGNLIECISKDNMCLSHITMEDKKGKKRKLGKNVVKIIVDYLAHKVEELVNITEDNCAIVQCLSMDRAFLK